MKALVANAKSPTALAVIRSLGKQGINVTGAADSRRYFPLYSKYCKHRLFLDSAPDDPENRVNELLDIVKREHFDVFLPVLPEKVLSKLAIRKNEFERFTKLPIPDFENFEVFDDKSKTAKLMRNNHVPGPITYFIENTTQLNKIKDLIPYPVLIKPHRGEGSDGIEIVSSPTELMNRYPIVIFKYGPCFVQEYLQGIKYTAVFLMNAHTEVKRFFIHKALREYPITGGPTCCLESVKYGPIFEYGLRMLKAINYFGIAAMEFIIDENDNLPKIIDVNPRFYGPLQGAIVAGVDLPFKLFQMAINGYIETDLTYQVCIKCRNLLFEDTKHLISVLRGAQSPKYKIGKMQTLVNYLKFHQDDAYFTLSLSDPLPAIAKTFNSIFSFSD